MDNEERIRDRAYALWIEAGSPEGRDEEFWHRAQSEIAEEDGADASEAESEISRPPLVAGAVPK
jgi:hypothetical protein